MSKKKGIIVSGYFNPIHKGHIEYFNNAKELADELFVIVNNDQQRALKGSKEFQKEAERCFIVSNIKSVAHCILSVDEDRTVCKTIAKIARRFWGRLRLKFCQWRRSRQHYHPRETYLRSNGDRPYRWSGR